MTRASKILRKVDEDYKKDLADIIQKLIKKAGPRKIIDFDEITALISTEHKKWYKDELIDVQCGLEDSGITIKDNL